MDEFNVHLGLGKHQLQLLNHCHMYLQVTCLSKLVLADGLSLIPGTPTILSQLRFFETDAEVPV